MAENSTLESTRPDTSSFVEHMRLVYFTLVAASVIIMIAITSRETSSAANFPGHSWTRMSSSNISGRRRSKICKQRSAL